jgi:hypothetical protein
MVALGRLGGDIDGCVSIQALGHFGSLLDFEVSPVTARVAVFYGLVKRVL